MKKILIAVIIMMTVFLFTISAHADPINLALTGTATQSSTYVYAPPYDYLHCEAHIAIDGITDGDGWKSQVTMTNPEYNAWWQVDLRNSYWIDHIVLWNRTDSGVQDRLYNFKVSILDDQNSIVWTQNILNPYWTFYNIDLPDNTFGRVVKVSLNGSNYLSLAEVQVYPVPEPTTIFLVGAGLIGLWGARKKFNK